MKSISLNLIFKIVLLLIISKACFAADWVDCKKTGYEFVLDGKFKYIGINNQGYSEYAHIQSKIVFVRIPGGEFWMGSSQKDVNRLIDECTKSGLKLKEAQDRYISDAPRHKVKLSPFLIAKYEISQRQWIDIMGKNPSDLKADDLPVYNLDYYDCKMFCDKLGLCLLTEAQWEFACRSQEADSFSYGNITPEDKALIEYKNKNGLKFVPVKSFTPNAFGLYHMHGNVNEWCRDEFDENYYKKAEAAGPNPVCVAGSVGMRGIVRGYDSLLETHACRCAHRIRVDLRHTHCFGLRPSYRLVDDEIAFGVKQGLPCAVYEDFIASPETLGFTKMNRWQELDVYQHNNTGIYMLLIPGGEFNMGISENEKDSMLKELPENILDIARECIESEIPSHRVKLSPFLIAIRQINYSVWEKYMGGAYSPIVGLPDRYNWPAAATFAECQEFCRKTWLVMPTEAQWEFCCRRKIGYFNEMFSTPEWCQDVYDKKFYKNNESSKNDPICATQGETYVVRGANLEDSKWNRIASRRFACPENEKYLGDDHIHRKGIGVRPVFQLKNIKSQ